tara:strand:+ start:476 stop:916 length:441 start_codon:yes stop_codon:yes gene_type:complete
MNEKIIPYQSCTKSVFLILGLILISWSILFSIFLIAQGAWPISIFLCAEYLVIVYLVKLYFKEKNIKDEININEQEILIKKYKEDKVIYSLKFNIYWTKVVFSEFKNKSKLLIRESNKESEVASFLHSDLKKVLYFKIKNKLTYLN